VAHISVVLTMLPFGDDYMVGAYNVCEKETCVLTLREEAISRFEITGTESFVWFHDLPDVREFNAAISHL